MHPERRRRDHLPVRMWIVAASAGLCGCGAWGWAPDEDVGPLAAHSIYTYTWNDDTCMRSGPACVEERIVVAVERARSSDRDVVDTSIDARGVLTLHAHDPGEATVELFGEDGYRRDLNLRVASLGTVEFVEQRVVVDHALLMPGATAAFGYELYTPGGEELRGIPRLEVSATGGATATALDDRTAIAVTAPAELGAFEVGVEGVGVVLRVDVVDEAEIDGVTSGRDFVAPTIGDHVLAAGAVEFRVTPAPGEQPCDIDMEGWGVSPSPLPAPDFRNPGDEAATWSAQVTFGCLIRLTLPRANDGAGLVVELAP